MSRRPFRPSHRPFRPSHRPFRPSRRLLPSFPLPLLSFPQVPLLSFPQVFSGNPSSGEIHGRAGRRKDWMPDNKRRA